MDHVGNVGFAILVIVFVLGTYALALSLESIMDQWARFRQEKWGRPGKISGQFRKDGDNEKAGDDYLDRESKLSFNVMGSCFGLRRRRIDATQNGSADIDNVSKVA